MNLKQTTDYKELSPDQTFEILKSSDKGLTSSEATERIKEIGYNEIAEKKESKILDLLKRFWNPMAWLLEIAAILCFFLKDYFDGVIMVILVVLNGVIAFYEENNSKKAMELLKSKLAIKCRILRDDKWITQEARELVPGDIINISLGEIVPADCQIISGDISADQSALTGESLPVEMREKGILYTGSIVKRGEAKAIVLNTGKNTFFGKTVELVSMAKPKSKQQEIMMRISKYMVYVGAVAFMITIIFGLDDNISLAIILTMAVLLIAGGVPMALPIMFTVAQSAGSIELSKQGILVTKLDAIENAASVEVLCMDKTGTITMNQFKISDVYPFGKYKIEDVVLYSAMASSKENRDVTDNAVMECAKEKNINLDVFKQISFKPFDPAAKRTEAIVELNGSTFKVMKGAPRVIISLCQNYEGMKPEEIEERVDDFSKKGYRVLGVARSEGENYDNLSFAGLLAISDPIRPDTNQMIQKIKAAGVWPVMLTGDGLPVAVEVAKKAGIGDKIVRIADIKNMTVDEKVKAARKVNGLAEIYPEDKFNVVKFLQQNGYTVGMTGDGVNDSPSLKQAEVGIAVSNATDVAKAAASLVLTIPGTEVILEAIKTSRKIYQRMLTWIINKVVKSIQFILILMLGFFIYEDVVVSITGLMVLLVVNDFLTMMLATDNAVSTVNPNKWNVRSILITSVVLGVLFFFTGVITMYVGYKYFHYGFEDMQTLVLMMLVYTSQLRVLCVRDRRHFWSSAPSRGILITTILTMVGFTLFALFGIIMTKMTPFQLLITFGISLITTFLIDFPKYYIFKKFNL